MIRIVQGRECRADPRTAYTRNSNFFKQHRLLRANVQHRHARAERAGKLGGDAHVGEGVAIAAAGGWERPGRLTTGPRASP